MLLECRLNRHTLTLKPVVMKLASSGFPYLCLFSFCIQDEVIVKGLNVILLAVSPNKLLRFTKSRQVFYNYV